MVKCIDVSKWQGTINWTQVKASGVDCVIMRAACHLTKDVKLYDNLNGAISAGLNVGVYLYTYATNVQLAEKEADFVLELVKGYKLTMPIAYDMEYEPSILALTNAQRTACCKAFLDKIEKAGYYAILYGSADFIKNRLSWKELEKYDKWVASYTTNPPDMPCSYGIWQYSSKGSIPGISGNVDCDIMYKDYPSIISGIGKSEDDVIEVKTCNTITVGPMSSGDYAVMYKTIKELADKLGNIKVKCEEVLG